MQGKIFINTTPNRRRTTKEDRFSKVVYDYFNEKLKKSKFSNKVGIVEKKQILKDITFINDKSRFYYSRTRWSFMLGFQQQDIVFVSKTVIEKKRFADSDMMEFSRASDIIFVPLVICELKIGKNLTTHQILTYSQIAREIRYISPFCKYFIIIDKNRKMLPETIARQAKEIDEVFESWEKNKRLIWRSVLNHFKYLQRLEII